MKQFVYAWEYGEYHSNFEDAQRKWVEKCNELGSIGWQLVYMKLLYANPTIMYYGMFMREINDDR